MRTLLYVVLCLPTACSSASWSDTFTGQDTRMADAGAPPSADSSQGDGGDLSACGTLASSRSPVPITVTFPGYDGGASATIHVTTSTGSCDVAADVPEPGILFSTDALTCAPLLAPGTPSFAQATASGANVSAPDTLTFQWGYSNAGTCTITDEYSLAKK